MFDSRHLKAWRDLGRHRARSLLVVVAVAVGLIGAGAILDTWALVQRATAQGYGASLPVSATLVVDRLDTAWLVELRALPGIAAVRARRSMPAAAQGNGVWRNALIVAFDDFDNPQIGRLQPDGGNWPPAEGTLVIERSSLDFSGATVGEPLSIKLGQGEPQQLPVGGVVRDVSLAPGWMENVVYSYASITTLQRLGAPAGFNELQIRVSDGAADRTAVRRSAREVKLWLAQRGAHVSGLDVPEPGQHIHAAQMESLLLTQAAFGLLALLVCAFLVVNLINAMLAGQAREIGVMKVLGASARQIGALYLGQALLLGLLASALALPLALLIGRQYAALKGELLNFPVDGYAVPAWAIALQLAVGLLLPVAAAALPVRRACRLSVGAALRDIGIVAPGQTLASGRRIAIASLGGLGGLGRPLLLAIGNAFRRRQRMLLTLLALASGGAVYLGAANLRSAVIGSVDLIFAAQRYELSLRLTEPQPAAALEATAAAVDGVAGAEAWRGKHASFGDGEGFSVIGLPPASTMLKPSLMAGRWLRPGDQTAIVLNRSLLKQQPQWQLGQTLSLSIDGQARPWTIVGIVDTGPQPLAYAPRASLDATHASSLVVALQGNAAARLDTIQRLRAGLALAGMPVAASQLQGESRRVVEDHLLMVVDFLGAMAWVMIVVGGMGLASTMSLAVLERTREIGVLRAIGARSGSILALVQIEGLVIVLLAWLVSLPLSVPMSLLLAEAFGRVMFPVPAQALPSPLTAAGWLALMALISLIACAWPALRAARLPAARALSYE